MKEVKDLIRDRKIVLGVIVVPLLLFPLMGAVINVSVSSAVASASHSSFALMNLDGGNQSELAVGYFTSLPRITVTPIQPQPVQSALSSLGDLNETTLVVIPAGFSSSVSQMRPASLDTYTVMKSFGIASSAGAGAVTAVVQSLGPYLSAHYIASAGPGLNASVILHPLTVNDSSFYLGKVVAESPSTLGSLVTGQSFTLPMATFIVIIFAMQIASASMGVEKEQKTLETLLTLPVSRFRILSAKLVGSTVIAGIGAVTSMIGFTYYMDSFNNVTGQVAANAVALVSPPLTYYLLLGVLIFLTLMLATSLAIVVSVFSADVRSAQAVVGYLALPIIIPSLVSIVGDFNTLPLAVKAAFLAFPFSYVSAFSTEGFSGDFTLGLIGVAYLAVWIVAVMYGASRLFSSERILTARFSFRRKKQVGEGT